MSNLNQLFEEILKEALLQEMTNSQVAVYAPVKLDGEIDTNYLKNESELESLKKFVTARKHMYKGYALIDVRIDKIVKEYNI